MMMPLSCFPDSEAMEPEGAYRLGSHRECASVLRPLSCPLGRLQEGSGLTGGWVLGVVERVLVDTL